MKHKVILLFGAILQSATADSSINTQRIIKRNVNSENITTSLAGLKDEDVMLDDARAVNLSSYMLGGGYMTFDQQSDGGYGIMQQQLGGGYGMLQQPVGGYGALQQQAASSYGAFQQLGEGYGAMQQQGGGMYQTYPQNAISDIYQQAGAIQGVAGGMDMNALAAIYGGAGAAQAGMTARTEVLTGAGTATQSVQGTTIAGAGIGAESAQGAMMVGPDQPIYRPASVDSSAASLSFGRNFNYGAYGCGSRANCYYVNQQRYIPGQTRVIPRPPMRYPQPPILRPRPPVVVPQPPVRIPQRPSIIPRPSIAVPQKPRNIPQPPMVIPQQPEIIPQPDRIVRIPQPPKIVPRPPRVVPRPDKTIYPPPVWVPQPPIVRPNPDLVVPQRPKIIQLPPIPEPQPDRFVPQPPLVIPGQGQMITTRRLVCPPQQPSCWDNTCQQTSSCSSHNTCYNGQMCCYTNNYGNTQCVPGNYRTVRQSYNQTVDSNATATLSVAIDQWRDANSTAFVKDMLLPMKMNLQSRLKLNFTPLDADQAEAVCSRLDADCVGSKVFDCALRQEAKDGALDDVSQIRLLSFSACLMQSYGAGIIERKNNALLAAKKCARLYQYRWRAVTTCVGPTTANVTSPAPEMEENDMTPTKEVLCNYLDSQKVPSIICELFKDELENPESATPNFEIEAEESSSEEVIESVLSNSADAPPPAQLFVYGSLHS